MVGVRNALFEALMIAPTCWMALCLEFSVRVIWYWERYQAPNAVSAARQRVHSMVRTPFRFALTSLARIPLNEK